MGHLSGLGTAKLFAFLVLALETWFTIFGEVILFGRGSFADWCVCACVISWLAWFWHWVFVCETFEDMFEAICAEKKVIEGSVVSLFGERADAWTYDHFLYYTLRRKYGKTSEYQKHKIDTKINKIIP